MKAKSEGFKEGQESIKEVCCCDCGEVIEPDTLLGAMCLECRRKWVKFKINEIFAEIEKEYSDKVVFKKERIIIKREFWNELKKKYEVR